MENKEKKKRKRGEKETGIIERDVMIECKRK